MSTAIVDVPAADDAKSLEIPPKEAQLEIRMRGLLKLGAKDLETFTDGFSEENFVCIAQFCKVYRGKIPEGWGGSGLFVGRREVTVKIWVDEGFTYHGLSVPRSSTQNLATLRDEITLLTHETAVACPNLPKLLGFCAEEGEGMLGVVYNFKSFDVLQNLFAEGDFDWCKRINVALGLAKVLDYFHGFQPSYVIRDYSSSHVMLDEDFNPIWFNFLALTGGIIGDKTKKSDAWKLKPFNEWAIKSFRYIDPGVHHSEFWNERHDVYAFGVVLLELIRKTLVCWVPESHIKSCEYIGHLQEKPRKESKLFSRKTKKVSLAEKSFRKEPGFDDLDACTITELVLLCVDDSPVERPTSKDIVDTLNVVQKKLGIVMI